MKNDERKAMMSRVQEMMQSFGIPSIEFADESGKVQARIDVPKPVNVPCLVPAYDGGTVEIKQGDHIRLWYRDGADAEWKIEGLTNHREAKGIVLFVKEDERFYGKVSLAYQRDNADKNEGASSCVISNTGTSWARVVEKI